jgi:hypothetical protein
LTGMTAFFVSIVIFYHNARKAYSRIHDDRLKKT